MGILDAKEYGLIFRNLKLLKCFFAEKQTWDGMLGPKTTHFPGNLLLHVWPKEIGSWLLRYSEKVPSKDYCLTSRISYFISTSNYT